MGGGGGGDVKREGGGEGRCVFFLSSLEIAFELL